MFLRLSAAFAAACLIAVPSPAARANAPASAPADPYGDPLPPGTVGRLGTIRLRHNCVSLAWAPDGKTFATVGGDGTVRLWDATSGKEVRQFRQTGVFYNSVLFEPDGKRLIAGGTDGGLHLLDAATGREGRTLTAASQQITAVAVRADDGMVVALGADGGLRVWDPTTGKIARQSGAGPAGVASQRRTGLSPDGRRYASWGPTDALTVRDDEGKELFTAPTQFRAVDGLAFSPDGKTLAVSSMIASQVALWDAATGKEIRRLDGMRVLGRALALSPDAKYLAGVGADGAVRVWGAASGKELRQFELPRGMLIGLVTFSGTPLAFSPDGKTLAAAQGLAVHLWDVEGNKDLHEFVGHNAPIDDLQFTPDGRGVLTCGKDGATGQWDAATGKLLAWRTRSEGGGQFGAVAGADGKSVLFSVQGGVARWDLGADKSTERPLATGVPGFPTGLTLSADGKTLAGMGQDRFIYVWDAQTGKEKAKVRVELPYPISFALSADGSLLAMSAPNAAARVWDVAINREVRVLDADPPPGAAVAPPAPFAPPVRYRSATTLLFFSPDGRAVVTGSGWELVVWELASGRDRMRVTRPGVSIGRIAFSRDGGLAAVGATTGEVRLLDATDGWELARFAGHTGGVTALTFAPDGRTLATAGNDGLAILWDVKEWAGRKPPISELSPEKLADAWTGLLDGDAGRAYKAVLALAASPKAAAPFLKGQLVGAKGPDAERIARLIKDLNDDQFDVRENADKELDKMGSDAMPAVRAALASDPPPESRRRLQGLLDRHKEAAAVSEEVRGGRAVEALERSGAPEAAEALRALAKEASESAVKEQAVAALGRLMRKDAAP